MIPKLIKLLITLALAASIISCGSGDELKITKVSRIVMGTLVEISAVGPTDKTQPAIDAAFSELKRVENLTSFHKSSDLTRLNKSSGEGPQTVDPELVGLITKSLEFSALSQGAFDPSIGPVAQLWNFSGESGPRLPDSAEIGKILPLIGWEQVLVDEDGHSVSLAKAGMALDLGAIAKGYAIDKATQKLKSLGVKAALVNAGGDIVAYGEKEPGKPWKIGVQDPRNPGGVIAVAELKDRAMVTSGDYERSFEDAGKRYHHLLDPKTGYPADGLQSVTIVAADGVTADALSTAVFVLGEEKGIRLIESLPDVAALLVDAQGKIIISQKAQEMFKVR